MKKFFEQIKNFCVKNLIGVILISLCLILIIAGTGVLMASGTTMAIENVCIGDTVKSYNPATGKVESKRVLQTFVNETDELVTVTTSDGQQITSTLGHKYYANNRWVSAEDLRAGDVLVNVNGEKVIVEQVQHEILDNPVKVYNFEVEDNHTYFVGTYNGIAVHNKRCGGYRQSLINTKGDMGKGYHAHHEIPKKINKEYHLGDIININDPKYLNWMEAHEHLANNAPKKYNQMWRDALDDEIKKNGKLTKEIVEEVWERLRNLYPSR